MSLELAIPVGVPPLQAYDPDRLIATVGEVVDAPGYLGIPHFQALPAADRGDWFQAFSAGTYGGLSVFANEWWMCTADGTPVDTPANWFRFREPVTADPLIPDSTILSAAPAYMTQGLISVQRMDEHLASRQRKQLFHETGIWDFNALGYPERTVVIVQNTDANTGLVVTYGTGGTNDLQYTRSGGSPATISGQDNFTLLGGEAAIIERIGTVVCATVFESNKFRWHDTTANAIAAGPQPHNVLVAVAETDDLWIRRTGTATAFTGVEDADWIRIGSARHVIKATTIAPEAGKTNVYPLAATVGAPPTPRWIGDWYETIVGDAAIHWFSRDGLAWESVSIVQSIAKNVLNFVTGNVNPLEGYQDDLSAANDGALYLLTAAAAATAELTFKPLATYVAEGIQRVRVGCEDWSLRIGLATAYNTNGAEGIQATNGFPDRGSEWIDFVVDAANNQFIVTTGGDVRIIQVIPQHSNDADIVAAGYPPGTLVQGDNTGDLVDNLFRVKFDGIRIQV